MLGQNLSEFHSTSTPHTQEEIPPGINKISLLFKNYATKFLSFSKTMQYSPEQRSFHITQVSKGSCHLRFSGIRPLRGYPPPLLTENQSEKKKVFFLSGKGGYPHPPLNGKSV